MIPVDGVRAFVTIPTETKSIPVLDTEILVTNGFIEWEFDSLGIKLKTELKSGNLSNGAIERLLVEVVQSAKKAATLIMEEGKE